MQVRIRIDMLYIVALAAVIVAIPVMLSANTFFASEMFTQNTAAQPRNLI